MISVAIDGPAGAGKSSVSRAVAERLGFIYVDTGALYRAVALSFLRNSASQEEEEVERVLQKTSVTIRFVKGEQHVFLNGEDVNLLIRTPEISMTASSVSAYPAVRSFLLNIQRDLAAENNVVMDGRDIGTVVLPNADVKIFLTASCRVRAERRYEQLKEKGTAADFEEVLRDIEKRDEQDTHRAAAPLKQAQDAILVDTSLLSFEQSVQQIIEIIDQKAGDRL